MLGSGVFRANRQPAASHRPHPGATTSGGKPDSATKNGNMGLAWPHKRWQWRAPTSGGIMRIGRHLDFPTHSPARTADFVSVHEMHQFLLHIIFVIVTITVHSRCSCLLSGPV